MLARNTFGEVGRGTGECTLPSRDQVMDEHLSFAVLLRRYRVAARLTQEELAERAALSARAITDLERGVRRFPYPDSWLAPTPAVPAHVQLTTWPDRWSSCPSLDCSCSTSRHSAWHRWPSITSSKPWRACAKRG
jgi:DNA-binding XRE family transcriptional regulator